MQVQLRSCWCSAQKRIVFLGVSLSAACLSLWADSPFISRVWEYAPAPGQFVNTLPAYEQGDDANDMRIKAEEALADNAQGMITLGGWGGYVVFGFDHMVENRPGEYDFVVLGNAMSSDLGASAEPGVVWVSYDANNNGRPDDTWYELAGSEYASPATMHDYSVTYFAPDDDHVATPDKEQPYLTDTTYIRWEASDGAQGYLHQLSYHRQPYFPQWAETGSLTFTGTRLAPNARFENDIFILDPYAYGYADNFPNDTMAARLMIDWAVDTNGTPVMMPGIHFVRVQTAVHQQCGQIGETSTEITGAIDLHRVEGMESIQNSEISYQKILRAGTIYILRGKKAYTITGQTTND